MRKLAVLGGIGYIIIFVTGFFANFFVIESYKVQGDLEATYLNFSNNYNMLIWAIMAFMLMIVFDVVLTGVLYILFKKVNSKLSKITAWFRLINVLFFGIALVKLFDVFKAIKPFDDINTSAIIVDNALKSFNDTWLIGLVFFGVHLVLLSIILKKSKQVYRVIPILLLIAGIGYIIDTTLQFGYSNYDSIKNISAFIVILPGVVGELSLTGWLLFKAGKNK